jgi:hypothetical protein
MSHIVDLVRKHQRMIVLVAALGVVALYIIPFDQIGNAISGDKLHGIDNAISHIQDTQQRILDKDFKNSYKISEHLGDVIDHLTDVKYRLLHL